MARDTGPLVLTVSQAACLTALRQGEDTKPAIALHARLDMTKAASTLATLRERGLVRQDKDRKWHATARGRICAFDTVPDRRRKGSGPGPAVRRLLALLERPMSGREIAVAMGVTRERVRQLILKLHAEGLITFGDPGRPYWMVMRAGDATPLLSREEVRVLKAIPADYATSATKIRLSIDMSGDAVRGMLDRLVASGYVLAREGFRDDCLYTISEAGVSHPQYVPANRPAQAPRLPVESDRVHCVLEAIRDAGALRIRDVAQISGVPRQSINGLMQYLKRKRLVGKTGGDYNAPYALTGAGHAALAEMTRRRAA